MASQKQSKDGPKHPDRDFAPSLDSEPVFERPAEDRWAVAEKKNVFAPSDQSEQPASSSWADNRSSFDLEHGPGPGFLDPGSHALANHSSPMMASESMHFGAIAGASSDLALAPNGGGGGGDGKGKPSATDLW